MVSVEAWSARGARRRVLDHALFVVDAGADRAATPALLVHGFPTSAHDWSPILDELAAERRVVACDLLGFGLSDKPWPHRYSLGEQADLVSELARALDLGRVHLVAHDMGDTVVQELLARHLHGGGPSLPFTVASVTLLNGGILVDRVHPILGQRLLRRRALRPLLERLPSPLARRLFFRSLRTIAGPDRPPPRGELDAQFDLAARDGGIRLLPHLIGYMREREVHRDRWRGALLRHPFPMRLVWGDADPINPWPIVEEIQRERPGTDGVRLERTGHYPQLERPAAVAAAIREHLRRHD